MDDSQNSSNSRSDIRLFRLLARAALYAAPQTPTTAREFCRVMGLRVQTPAQLKPASLVQLGRSKRAPFGDWLESINLPSPEPRHAPSSRTRSQRTRR